MLSIRMIEDKLNAGMTPAEIDLGSWRRNLRVIRSQKIEKYSDLQIILDNNDMGICACCYVYDSCKVCSIKRVSKRLCRSKGSLWNDILKAKTNKELIYRVSSLIDLLGICAEKEKGVYKEYIIE